MSFASSADRSPIVGPDRVRNVIQAVLRSAQAKFTDEQLEGLTGVSARCIKSYRVEGREPTLGNALSILCVLGQSNLNLVLALIGYSARALDEANELQLHEIVATGLENFTIIARAAIDGRIDHIEKQGCTRAADLIIETVLPLSSAGQAA
jgi:hypothetical protein